MGDWIVREPLVGSPWSWGRDFAFASAVLVAIVEAPVVFGAFAGLSGPPLWPMLGVGGGVTAAAFAAGTGLARLMAAWRRSVPLGLWIVLGAMVAAILSEALWFGLGGDLGETLFGVLWGLLGGGAAFVVYLVARVTRSARWPALAVLALSWSIGSVVPLILLR